MHRFRFSQKRCWRSNSCGILSCRELFTQRQKIWQKSDVNNRFLSSTWWWPPRVETCCNFKPKIKVVLTEIYMLFIIDVKVPNGSSFLCRYLMYSKRRKTSLQIPSMPSLWRRETSWRFYIRGLSQSSESPPSKKVSVCGISLKFLCEKCVEEIRNGVMVCLVGCQSRHVSRLDISPIHFGAIWLLPLRISQVSLSCFTCVLLNF